MTIFSACRSCLADLPPAVSGSGGHAATFRAACGCVLFGLSDADAMVLLREWNSTHCRPKWTERELEHKLKDARRESVVKLQSVISPKPAVRVVWKIERQPVAATPLAPAMPKQQKDLKNAIPAVPAVPSSERPPRLSTGGDSSIPFDLPFQFHWKRVGQSGTVIMARLRATGVSRPFTIPYTLLEAWTARSAV